MRSQSTRLLRLGPLVSPIHEAAHRFSAYLGELERRLRRGGDEVPTLAVKREVASKLWSFLTAVRRAVGQGGDFEAAKHEVRRILGPWLWRSTHFHRCFHRPHGFSGDHVTMEGLYALEVDALEDPLVPPLVTCLDYAFATLPAVQALWARRRRIAAELERAHVHSGRRLSVLDVGAGSAPYLRDLLGRVGRVGDRASVELTLVDRDPTALRFLTKALAAWDLAPRCHGASLAQLGELVEPQAFDVVIAAGVLDELDDELAADAVFALVEAVRPGGLVIATCPHPADGGALALDWLLDWRPVRRDEGALAALFPEHVHVTPDRTSESALAYAFAIPA